MNPEIANEKIHHAVQQHYRELALDASQGKSCCGSARGPADAVLNLMYEGQDLTGLPADVTDISLGCGDPITLASLQPGQRVLDLGSGGGIDCFLAAKKVGGEGYVIGVDMTQEMVDLARANARRLGAENVDFRLGQIENLPLENDAVDVVISNCVINLSPDKPAVFSEAFRVLKPGGKFAVSDIVTRGELPPAVRDNLSAWAGCLAGAWDVADYIAAMARAGFESISVEPQDWDPEFYQAAAEGLDPELQAQIRSNQEQGITSLVINDGTTMKVVAYDGGEFDPQKSIFSARITAWKPS